MFGNTSEYQLQYQLKRDVILSKEKQSTESVISSSISDFKAFAEVNKELIIRMRH